MDYNITDCTLRDGGYYTDWDFDTEIIDQYLGVMSESPVNMIEIGYVSPPVEDYRGRFYYLPDQVLQHIRERSKGKQLAAMVNTKEVTTETLTPVLKRVVGNIDTIRFAASFSIIPKALDCIEIANDMGFTTALNIMHLSSPENIAKLWDILKKHKKHIETVDIIYLVDSYGGLYPDQITNMVSQIKTIIPCKIGLHGHNNLELAFANTLAAAEADIDYIDATLAGIGRGAGNLRMELLLTHLHRIHGLDVDLSAIARIAEMFEDIRADKEARNNMAYTISGAFGLPQADVMKWLGIRRYTVDSVVSMLTQHTEKEKSRIPFDPSALNLSPAKDALVVGGGHSISEHSSAIIEFARQRPDIIIIHSSARWLIHKLNEWKELPNRQLLCLAGDETYKLQHVYETTDLEWLSGMIYSNNPTRGSLPESIYGVSCYTLNSTYKSLSNTDSPAPLSLAIVKTLSSNKVYLVGFDGYAQSDIMLTVHAETQQAFNATIDDGLQLTSLTPTHYNRIPIESIYSLI